MWLVDASSPSSTPVDGRAPGTHARGFVSPANSSWPRTVQSPSLPPAPRTHCPRKALVPRHRFYPPSTRLPHRPQGASVGSCVSSFSIGDIPWEFGLYRPACCVTWRDDSLLDGHGRADHTAPGNPRPPPPHAARRSRLKAPRDRPVAADHRRRVVDHCPRGLRSVSDTYRPRARCLADQLATSP